LEEDLAAQRRELIVFPDYRGVVVESCELVR
jgi:hypothetical protein